MLPNKVRYRISSLDHCYTAFLAVSGANAGAVMGNNYGWGGVTHNERVAGCTLAKDNKIYFDTARRETDNTENDGVGTQFVLCVQEQTTEDLAFATPLSPLTCEGKGYEEISTLADCFQYYVNLNTEGQSRGDITTHTFTYDVDRRDRGRCVYNHLNHVAYNPHGSKDACGAGGWNCVCRDAPTTGRRLGLARSLEVSVTVQVEEDLPSTGFASFVYADVECENDGWRSSVWLCMQDFVFHPTDIFYYTAGDQPRVRVGTTSTLASSVQERLDLCMKSSNSLCDVGDEVSDAFMWYAVGGMVGFFCLLVPLAVYRRDKDDRVRVMRVPKVDLEAVDTSVEEMPLVKAGGLRTPESWY